MNSSTGLLRITTSPTGDEIVPTTVVSWEQLHRDRPSVEFMATVGREYQELADKLIDDCHQLSSYENICYLIDFDVLRDYIEVRTGRQGGQTYSIDFLFHNSRCSYALPRGTYLELHAWLRGLHVTAKELSHVERSIDREEFPLALASDLGIDVSSGDPDEAIEESFERIDGMRVVLTRLLRFQTDERFQGLIADYDAADAQFLTGVLVRTPRYEDTHLPPGTPARQRDQRDSRDAVNLATAIKRARNAREARAKSIDNKTTGFILISSTAAVLDLSFNIGRMGGDKGALSEQLCDILGLESMIVPTSTFPVLDPQRAMDAEHVGVYENEREAIARVEEIKRHFGIVASHFRNALLYGNRPRKNIPIFQAEEERAEESFGKLTRIILTTRIRLFEERRATALSVEFARLYQPNCFHSLAKVLVNFPTAQGLVL